MQMKQKRFAARPLTTKHQISDYVCKIIMMPKSTNLQLFHYDSASGWVIYLGSEHKTQMNLSVKEAKNVSVKSGAGQSCPESSRQILRTEYNLDEIVESISLEGHLTQ